MEKKSKRGRKATYACSVGRRKTAAARVRLFAGKGEILVNDKPVADYFPGEVSKIKYLLPFTLTETVGKYHATIKVTGSGKNSQLDAVVHGLTRALDKENKKLFHSVLKQNKLLTRDPRARERRKPGLGGKSRRQKQSPKR